MNHVSHFKSLASAVRPAESHRLLMTILICLLAVPTLGQTAGDFRSRASGSGWVPEIERMGAHNVHDYLLPPLRPAQGAPVVDGYLTELLPPEAPRAHRIAFRDSDVSWTRAEIAIVGSASAIPSRGVSELLATTLRADSVSLEQDATRSHLRLVQIRRAA